MAMSIDSFYRGAIKYYINRIWFIQFFAKDHVSGLRCIKRDPPLICPVGNNFKVVIDYCNFFVGIVYKCFKK